MGIQIKGSNDTISAADGSMVLEGAALTFTNENITGISTMGTANVTSGALSVSQDIVHIDDTDTKISFTNNQIDLQTGGVSRMYASNYAVFVRTGFPLAFLASSGDSPNIKSGGTNNQDILFTAGTSNPTRLQVTSSGTVGINTGATSTANAGFDDLVIRSSAGGNTGITLLSSTTAQGTLAFADGGSSTEPYRGYLQYSHNGDRLVLGAGGADRVTVDSVGNVNIAGVTTATGFYPTTAQTGRRNMFINGNMSIAQRSTSSASGGYQTIDRFYTHWSGGNGTVSQQTLANGDEIEGSTHYLRMATGSGGSSDYTVMRCPLEDVRRFSGDITVSFWAKYVTNAPNGGLTLWWQTNYGSGGTTGGSTAMQVFNGSGLPSLTTSWAKYSLTFSDFPSLSGKTIGDNNFAELLFGQGTNAGGTAWTLDITNIQVERGKSASAFEQISQQENLALCQRYFRRDGGGDYTGYGMGVINNTSGGIWTMPLDPPMRVAPTITNEGNVRIYDGSNNANVTAWNTNRSTTKNFWIEPTTSSSSFTVGRAFLVGNNSDTNGYVNLNAELPI